MLPHSAVTFATIYSERGLRMVGMQSDALLGKSLWDVFPDGRVLKFFEEYQLALDTGEARHFEEFYPEPLNMWLSCHAYPGAEGLTVYFHDITDRRRAEDALREREERYRTLFNSIEQGFCIVEMILDEAGAPVDYRIIEGNPAFSRFTGLHDWGAGTVLEMIPGLERWWVETYGRIALTGVSERFENYAAPMGKWFEVYAFRFGDPLRLQVAIFFKDITAKKQADQAIERHRAQLEAIYNAMNDGLAVFDMQGELVLMNEAQGRFCGCGGTEEFRNNLDTFSSIYELRSLDGSIVPVEDWPVSRVLRGESITGLDLIVLVPDSGKKWVVSFSGEAVRDDHGNQLLAVIVSRDITERRAAEEQLEETSLRLQVAKEEAERANRAKDEFLATLSHELRTPLTPVLMMIQLLLEDRSLPAGLQQNLRMIHHNVNLEIRLIDDLLDLTRISRGKLQVDLKPVDAVKVISRVVPACCEDEIRKKNMSVDIRIDADWSMIMADEARLSQIVWNVFKNAVKFSDENGTVSLGVWNPNAEELAIRIRDNGIGIDPKKLDTIFNAFEQGAGPRARRADGLGLGLAITRVLTELHGGTISAHSEGQGQGAEFVIRFPVQDEVEQADAGRHEAPAGRGDGSLQILMIEDHPDTATMLARLLSLRGHHVQHAGSVAEALEVASRSHFDLVLSDLGLPDGSGTELMAELRNRYGLSGIALSGFGMEEDIRKSKEAGFSDHLVKPVSIDHLYAALADFELNRRDPVKASS